MDGLGEEDQKIIALARSARARSGAAEGAAVRDETGRTYMAATVDLPSLRLSALRLAVAMAVSSGATALEAGILLAQLLCGLATVTSASRMLYAFARDGGVPFSATLRAVNPTFSTPVAA